MLAIYGSHSEFFLLRKYHFHKKLQFQTILLPYKKCVTKKRTHVKKDYGHPERALFKKIETLMLGQTNWAEFL